jgi:hypothetical protein
VLDVATRVCGSVPGWRDGSGGGCEWVLQSGFDGEACLCWGGRVLDRRVQGPGWGGWFARVGIWCAADGGQPVMVGRDTPWGVGVACRQGLRVGREAA